jgi:hypothetical protein
MAFVRYKIVKGRKYYQVVRNYRENGKHRQQVLCHLGQHRSLDAAIDYEKRMVSTHLRSVDTLEKEAESTEGYLIEFYGDRFTDKLPTLKEAYSEWDNFLEKGDASFTEVRDGVEYIKSSFIRGSFIDPEYEQEVQRYHRRRRHERALLNSIIDYYNAKAEAKYEQKRADEHRRQLDKYLAVRSAYS